MHEVLINNYNASVRPQDVGYFLGDMGMGKSGTLKKVIDRLNGTKILIIGNHDGGVQSMYSCGFDAVLHTATMYIANERVTLSHCPLFGVWREDATAMKGSDGENWHGESRKVHQRLTVPDFGQFHLHGHIHSRPGRKVSDKILGRQYDVGVSANKYTPVSISTIESFIVKTKEKEN